MHSGKIRICYALNTFDLGGAETVALDLARSHDPGRFDVELVAFTEPRRSEEPEMLRRCRDAGIRTAAIVQPDYRSPLAIWRIYRYLRRGRFDIVHGHNRGADLWGVRLGARTGARGLFWTRHLVYHGMRPRHARRYRAASRQAWKVIAVSDAVRRACSEIEGIPAERVETVVNGIDLERYRPLPDARREEVRAALGVGPGERMVLFVGRFSAQKAPDAFLATVAEMRRSDPSVRGYMCGYGPLAQDLERAAGEAGVRILGLRSDVPDLLGACDLFVSTSRNEGLPLNVMEAMAAGAPFVAPGIPQIAQLVSGTDRLAAQLMPPAPLEGDVPADLVRAWAERAAATLADPGRAREAGRAGRDVIARAFSLAAMVGRYEQLFLESLESSRTAKDRP